MAQRFGLVAVAGELATHYGVTGWSEGEATQAASLCFAAWLDSFGGTGNREDRALLAQVRREVAVIQPPGFSRTAHTFSHIFAGGYAAGYYSYKWAEVLSADAYSAFEETAGKDGAPNVETGRKYRQAILEAGGSRPAMESFKAFRGREPSLDALLRHQGMA